MIKHTDVDDIPGLQSAIFAFWQALAAAHPDVVTGDFDPGAELAFDRACVRAAESWLASNGPSVYKRCGYAVISTGGGCQGFSKAVSHRGAHILVTAYDDCDLPDESDTNVAIGLYNGEGEPVKTFLPGSEIGGVTIALEDLEAITAAYAVIGAKL